MCPPSWWPRLKKARASLWNSLRSPVPLPTSCALRQMTALSSQRSQYLALRGLSPASSHTQTTLSVSCPSTAQAEASLPSPWKLRQVYYSTLSTLFDLEAKEMIHSWWDRDGYSLTLAQCCNLILSLRKIRISYMADLMGLIFSSMHSLCSHFQLNGFLTHVSLSNNIWVCSVGKIWEVELWQKGCPPQGTGHRKWILCLHLSALSSFVSLFR